ncbi:MAG: hypothetical protein Q9179_004590 [Wetmoreana sp. 5 TL-2023]
MTTACKPLLSVIFILLLLFLLHLCTATPTCENQMHPLPPLSSCVSVIQNIYHEAKAHPFLYTWSHHAHAFDEQDLPRTWISEDEKSYFTYVCVVTVDLVQGHEDEEDSFTFKDVAYVANTIVRDCLTRERGMRPQVGWEMIGFFHRPKVVRVSLGSVRKEVLERVGNNNKTVNAMISRYMDGLGSER